MSGVAAHRTPISILQEICVKKCITPRYELVSSEGPIHEPLYVFTCTAGPFSATAKGTSKKQAKHQASYLILLKFLEGSFLTESEKAILGDYYITAANFIGLDCLDSLENFETDGQLSMFRHKEGGNLVGQLQELCQKNMWPPPKYEFTVPSNASCSLQQYTCIVKLWKWSYTGVGNSKKSAKRRAACGLLENIIKNNLHIPQEALDYMEEENLTLLDKDESVHDNKCNDEAASRIASKALRGVWNNKGEKVKVNEADQFNDSTDPCELLEKVAEREKFTVLYSFVTEPKSGKVYCLIELSTTPPFVIKCSSSENLEVARRNAAKQCLYFLQVMSAEKSSINYDKWIAHTSGALRK